MFHKVYAPQRNERSEGEGIPLFSPFVSVSLYGFSMNSNEGETLLYHSPYRVKLTPYQSQKWLQPPHGVT